MLGVSKVSVNTEGDEIQHVRFIGMENFLLYTQASKVNPFD